MFKYSKSKQKCLAWHVTWLARRFVWSPLRRLLALSFFWEERSKFRQTAGCLFFDFRHLWCFNDCKQQSDKFETNFPFGLFAQPIEKPFWLLKGRGRLSEHRSFEIIIYISNHVVCPQKYFTSPHLTSPHLTSPHLTSPHLTSTHLTSPQLTSPHLTSHYLVSHHIT
jgi:hypothetical protein